MKYNIILPEKLEEHKKREIFEALIMYDRGFFKHILKKYNIRGRTKIFKLWDYYIMMGAKDENGDYIHYNQKELREELQNENAKDRKEALNIMCQQIPLNELIDEKIKFSPAQVNETIQIISEQIKDSADKLIVEIIFTFAITNPHLKNLVEKF